jgi:diguanylate cyclase (GGDEF)-like protein/PAS domain S-box-containing protein
MDGQETAGARDDDVVADRRFWTFFERAPMGVTVTDSDSNVVVAANHRYAEIVGRVADELVGSSWTEYTHPDDLASDLALADLGRSDETSTDACYQLAKRYLRPDGTVVSVDMSIVPIGPNAVGRLEHLCIVDDVTERRQTEERLVQLGQILEASPDYVATTDVEGFVLWANAATRALMNLDSGDDVLDARVSLFSLFSPGSADRFLRDAIPQLWATGAWVGEIEGRYPDGATFPLSFSAIAHFGDDGYPQMFSGIARDITATKLTEHALADSERRMRTLVDSAPIGIFETNPWGACIYVNPAFCDITRISDAADALGFGWGKVLHPDDAGAVGSQWAVAIKTDQPFIGQFRFLTPAGDVVWADINAVPVKGDDGATELFLGTVLDITERLALERAQFEASELFRTAFDDAPTGMALTSLADPHEVVLLKCNAAYASILGVTEDEALGTNLLDRTHPDHVAVVLEARRQLIAGEIDVHRSELMLSKADGTEIWIEMTKSIVRDAAGHPQYGLSQVSDITAQRKNREQIELFAFTDPLTGLPNRRSFVERLDQACSSRRERDARVALLFIDLDRFKTINDRLGHDAGDALLIEVARALESATRSSDTVARLGGDEFAIIVSGVGDLEMQSIAERLMRQLHFPRIMPEGDVVTVTASIGLAWATLGETVDEFLRRADMLMYQAKQGGRDQIAVDDRR